MRDVSVGARFAFLLALQCALCQIWLFGMRKPRFDSFSLTACGHLVTAKSLCRYHHCCGNQVVAVSFFLSAEEVGVAQYSAQASIIALRRSSLSERR